VPFPTWWSLIDQNEYDLTDVENLPDHHFLNNADLQKHFNDNAHLWNNVFVHPVFDTLVMAGNGTIGLELIEDLGEFDAVIIPYGGGALACGIASAIRPHLPNCRIYAVEVETAAPLNAAWEANSPQQITYQPTFVDGIGSSCVIPQMFELASKLLDGVIVVSLDEIASAVKLVAERNKVIVEGAGAAPVAAALSGKAGEGKIVCICSGGGLDSSMLSHILTQGTPPVKK